MKVKELIEKLQTMEQTANVTIQGNGKGGSPFIDLSPDNIYETEDHEPQEATTPSLVYTDREGSDYRKVVVLFESDDLY